MLDAIAQKQIAEEKLRAFLHDVARGCLTRRGYRTFTLMWLGRATSRGHKAQVGQAVAAGLIRWPSTGPNVVAELTDKGRAAIKGAA